jgi:gamma-glutamylcyclotransferase (GGCT)/AIG2-like uncharacterized protein YtfP
LYAFGWHPGAVLSNTDGEWVIGDLFQMYAPEKILPALDDYESFAFERKITPVHLDSGRRLNAWVYVYRGPLAGPRIPTGIWRTRD